jgi:hypothetical protein
MTLLLLGQPDQGIVIVSGRNIMNKKPAPDPAATDQPASSETESQRFARILAREEFKPLKAVFENLGAEFAGLHGAIITTNCYQNFLGKLGYRIVLVKQIQEQDFYSRLGPAGGLRAVLPVHNPATYSTLVTLVAFDFTVTTTPNAVDLYDEQLAEFKTQLMSRAGNHR